MAFDLGSFLGSNLGEMFSKVVGTFKADPNKVLEMQQAIAANSSAFDLKQIELQEKLQDSINIEVQAASANIRAEAQSGDKYTSRARPTFMYIVEAILGWNYILVPFIQIVLNRPIAPFPLPGDLLTLFGICITGYVAGRSFDKLMSLPGESSMSLGGIKASNKR